MGLRHVHSTRFNANDKLFEVFTLTAHLIIHFSSHFPPDSVVPLTGKGAVLERFEFAGSLSIGLSAVTRYSY